MNDPGRQPDYRPPSQTVVGLMIGGGILGILAIALFALGVPQALSGPEQKTEPVPEVEAGPAPAPQQPTTGELLDQQKTLLGAVIVTRQTFGDSTGDEDASSGAALLASWMDDQPPAAMWKQLDDLPDNRRAEIEKDAVPYRGKKLCVRGSIIEIHADRSMTPPVFWGVMGTTSFDFVRFVAVGSTRGIVEDSSARFCGIVIGMRSYPNRMGAQVSAIEDVGLFDIRENR